jgi:hypothetical protein
MLNRFVLLTIVTVVSVSPVSPVWAEESATSFVGPFVSMGVGQQTNHIQHENVRTIDNISSFDQPAAFGSHLLGQIQAGYGLNLTGKFNLAANLFYNIGGEKVGDITATALSDRVNQSLSDSRGIFLAPGYYVHENMLFFIKLGVVWADQTYKRDAHSVALDNTVMGSVLGVGAKYALTKHVYVTADLNQYNYGLNAWTTSLNPPEVIVSSKSKQVNGLVSVGYQF